ncbi:hypothetical protein KCP76_23810 [Salmonella enterica subsp. enterica serovar Weltevreden]|nr:hypothetical protein KCP76_23810 [Salmonella enterica subsp. enterica serovar Weltevreden]
MAVPERTGTQGYREMGLRARHCDFILPSHALDWRYWFTVVRKRAPAAFGFQ